MHESMLGLRKALALSIWRIGEYLEEVSFVLFICSFPRLSFSHIPHGSILVVFLNALPAGLLANFLP